MAFFESFLVLVLILIVLVFVVVALASFRCRGQGLATLSLVIVAFLYANHDNIEGLAFGRTDAVKVVGVIEGDSIPDVPDMASG